MPVLGAILAGGKSRRFGADKALALLDGRPLIAHVVAALEAQCGALAICGREWGGLPMLADVPAPGLGPLGGLAAAMAHAPAVGCDQVLLAPCDMPGLPHDLVRQMTPAPAVADGQWLVGLWPAALLPMLETLLRQEGAVSMRRWIAYSGARAVAVADLRNINRPADLSTASQQNSSY